MAQEIRQSTSKRKRAEAATKEGAKNRRTAFVLACILIVVLAFLFGFFLRSQVQLMAALGIPVGTETVEKVSTAPTKSTYDALSERVGEVEEILKTHSLDNLELDPATVSMLTDLMKSIDDPYAAYYSPDRYEKYIKESADKRYSGIGVLFSDYQGRACVIDVFPGSEAEVMGVAQGDFVQAIDGDSSHDWTMTEVVGALSRKDGQKVIITWMRPSSIDAATGTEFTTTLECHNSEVENITTELREGDVGYIKIRQNTATAAANVEQAVEDLLGEGATSFVLDVRDNPGGYLTQAVDIASLFVQNGVLVEIKTVEGITNRTASGKTLTDAPIVVLMNEFTCASAEVLAAALQDNQRAVTVGTKTMGKGSVQVVRELTFGGAIRYTAAYYLTPLGHEINDVGVTPEISVVSPDTDDVNDTQLIVALDTARSRAER